MSIAAIRNFALLFAMLTGALLQGQEPEGGEPTPKQASEDVRGMSEDVRGMLEAAEAEIRDAIASYVTAFNARESDRLLAHWTENGVYIDRTSGRRVQGRAAMSTQFNEMFADEEDSPKLAVETESIEFLSPRVALENGVAVVTRGDVATESAYTVVFVKDADGWLMDRVSEEEIVTPPTHYEQLSGLEWLIGKWIDAGEGFSLSIDCDWTANQNFISRRFNVTSDDGFDSSGLQIIGWDAKHQQIRSWLFDSNGVVITGTWTQDDDTWEVQSVATLEDGSSGSFLTKMTPIDENSYLWKKVNQVVDGKLLPNIDAVVIQRQ